MKAPRLLFVFFALAIGIASQAHAGVMLGNLSGSEDGGLEIRSGPEVTQACAQGINVGNGAPSYILDEVQIRISLAIDSSSIPTMTIYNDGVFNPGSTVIGTLNLISPLPPPDEDFAINYVFTPAEQIILNAETTYWIAVSVGGAGYYVWDLTESDPTVAVENWSFNANAVSEFGGPWERAGWTFVSQVSATAVPEPSAALMFVLGLGIVLRRWARTAF